MVMFHRFIICQGALPRRSALTFMIYFVSFSRPTKRIFFDLLLHCLHDRHT